MSFLNLSAIQAILVALLTLGAVLALFFLKLRHRRVVVGSALLWHRVLHDQRANSLVEKLRRLISLLIAITIALLIAMSVGRPYFSSSGSGPQPVVIVLDASESMGAVTASGQTRWQAAINEAMRIVEGSNSPAGVMAADTAGRVQTPVTDDRSEILDALGRMQPFAGEGRFPELPTTDARIYFISDGVATPSNVPDNAITVSVFEAADNVGITSFEIRVDPTSPSGYTAFLEVTNYSETAKEVAIVVAGVGGQRVVRGANINSNASWNEALDLQGFEGGGIQARVQADGDQFGTDDEAFAYMPARGELSVMLVTSETDGYLETLLELTPEVQLSVSTPESYEESVSTDVYVFDSFAPSTPPGRPSLLLGPSPAPWLPEVRGQETDLQISTWDEEHPVMRFVPVYDLGIGQAQVVDAGDRSVVASSDGTPLILVDDGDDGGGGTRSVIVTFGLEDSDFAIHLGFPIFVENVLAWFSGETLAQTSQLGEIELPAGTSQINRLDGTEMETTIRAGRVVVELTEPDLLTAVTDGRRNRVAVNMTSPEGSAINATSLDAEQTGPAPLPLAGNELWFYMLIGAMLLIAVEWWTYHRRITL